MLARRIILGIVLLGVAGLAYVGYKSWMAKRAMMGGDVYSDAVDSPGTTLKQSVASAAASAASQPVPPAAPTSQQTADQPAGAPRSPSVPLTSASLAAKPAESSPGIQTISNPVSANDSISPNPPNGTVFAATGHFQVYRQGNLTWRINTETGRACVLFATQQEWKKPQVYRNGCGSTAAR